MSKNMKLIFAGILLSGIVTLAFADDAAPVYDADNFPPQFDGQADVGPTSSGSGTMITQSPSPTQSMSLDQRITRAERQINNLQHKETSNKIETLQTEIQSLRGQVEQLSHQLQQVQTQQKTMYSDLDKRVSAKTTTKLPTADVGATASSNANEVGELKKEIQQLKQQLQQANNSVTTSPSLNTDDVIPQKSAAISSKSKQKNTIKSSPTVDIAKTKPDSVTPAVSSAQPNVAEEQQIYQTAYDLIKLKKYNEAISALQKMLQKYPSGQFAANAHYWLGELYGLLGKNDQSAVEFSTVVGNYPDSPKVADAQLKLGLIYAGQFKWSDAKSTFKKIINHYPGTASARLAAEQLKQIKEAGH